MRCLQASARQDLVATLIGEVCKVTAAKMAGAYLLSVSVPVLSEHNTSMPDISSKQLNLRHEQMLETLSQRKYECSSSKHSQSYMSEIQVIPDCFFARGSRHYCLTEKTFLFFSEIQVSVLKQSVSMRKPSTRHAAVQ